MTREGLKSQILEQISQNSSKIIETGEGIFRHPELGFKETRTSGVVRNVLTDLGLDVIEGLAVTGVAARLETGRPGPLLEANHRVNRALQAGSSDMGDFMHVMPAIHPGCGRAVRTAHSEEFLIQDLDTAYVLPSKLMALTVVELLWNDAALGRKVRDEFHPAMTKDEYFAMWDRALAPRALKAQGGS